MTVLPSCIAATANVPSGEKSRTKFSVRLGAPVEILEGEEVKSFERHNRTVRSPSVITDSPS